MKYETVKRYFDYAYCRTLYSIQGKSIEKIKFCKEDIKMLNNEQVYTFISRFKEPVDITNKIQYQLDTHYKESVKSKFKTNYTESLPTKLNMNLYLLLKK